MLARAPFRVFIGFDERQPLAFTVCQSSIQRYASRRVVVEPLVLSRLPLTRRGLTAFTYSRWLVPWLCDYQGAALFIDPDTVVRRDLTQLDDLADPAMAVSVVQGSQRFEWASLMLFQCGAAACRTLTPAYVEDVANQPATFAWVPEDRLGALPRPWNHLVGYDPPDPTAYVYHYTAGIPCWPETAACEGAALWVEEARWALSTVTWEALMGQSVHRPVVEALRQKAAS